MVTLLGTILRAAITDCDPVYCGWRSFLVFSHILQKKSHVMATFATVIDKPEFVHSMHTIASFPGLLYCSLLSDAYVLVDRGEKGF